MFRLEKVFQNDDSGYIIFVNLIKSISILLSIYTFSILRLNTIFDFYNTKLFINSNFFKYAIILSITYFLNSFFFKDRINYKINFISFLREDIINLFISNFLTLAIIFIFNFEFEINVNLLIILILLIFILGILKLYFNYLYEVLIKKNIIQKNIMLVGTYNEIKEILKNNFDNIFIFKCCMLTDFKFQNIRIIKSEFKFPIFNENEDIRSILEYHSLGQIWILNGDDLQKQSILTKIFKFSVDTLNINLHRSINLHGKKLLANKYDFQFYEKSRFYGINLFLKILIDKALSIIFLILASPLLILSFLFIYLEDGFPILFTQNRTGWDGRRFKIYKLRSLKKIPFDKTMQVSKDDKRLLISGKFIRRFSIDEIPQFFNVLNGDMSIVGPRPHMVEHDIHYSNIFGNFLKRHKCNPGLTGWAQVNGLRGATPHPDIMKRRMEFDLWYLNNWTIFLDIYIIFKTFYAIFKYKGD